jgi:hypothetical protein
MPMHLDTSLGATLIAEAATLLAKTATGIGVSPKASRPRENGEKAAHRLVARARERIKAAVNAS